MASPVVKPAPVESLRRSIRSSWLLWIGCIILIALSTYLYVRGVLTGLRVSFADDQTAIFEEMRRRAENMDDPTEGAQCLEYVVRYYPSGSKQLAGSKLDDI